MPNSSKGHYDEARTRLTPSQLQNLKRWTHWSCLDKQGDDLLGLPTVWYDQLVWFWLWCTIFIDPPFNISLLLFLQTLDLLLWVMAIPDWILGASKLSSPSVIKWWVFFLIPLNSWLFYFRIYNPSLSLADWLVSLIWGTPLQSKWNMTHIFCLVCIHVCKNTCSYIWTVIWWGSYRPSLM